MILDGRSADAIDQAARRLAEGGLVAFPTETVYGLGADAGSDAAVAGIFAAKGRPSDHPLIVHVADADESVEIETIEPAPPEPAASTTPSHRARTAGISPAGSACTMLPTVVPRLPLVSVVAEITFLVSATSRNTGAVGRPLALPSRAASASSKSPVEMPFR